MSKTNLFTHSEALGRTVRTGSWDEQSVGTYSRTREAIVDGALEDAAGLVDFFVQEAKVLFALYTQINPDIRAFMTSKGLSSDEVDAVDRAVLDLLALPDGRSFERDAMLARVEQLAAECTSALASGDPNLALDRLDLLKETWRQVKDRDGDHCYGLIDAVVRRFGEAAIGDMWETVIRPLFVWRYAKFDVALQPWEESLDVLMMVACESMRAHLVGVERTGDFELIELDDRFVLRFDPCGSGGRIVRGDVIEGTPSRMEPPYNWGVSEEPHTWNHGQRGICHYCTHCIRLMEEMPIDRFGYPVRVVDPPVYPDADPENRQFCQWQMFKDPAAVPVEFYERVGRTKGAALGGDGNLLDDPAAAQFLGNG